MTTPGRASFAGLTANRPSQSPSFRDIARLIIAPNNEKLKGFMDLERALVAALLIVAFILVTLYAVTIVFMPYIRTLLLALLFGSFLHPMKRTLAQFFKQILNEIREDGVPILAGLSMPFVIIDRLIDQLRLNVFHYALEIVNFGRTILQRDARSALAVCMAAMSLVIIGGNSMINFVMSINLIIFVTEITKTVKSFSDAYLHFLIRSFVFAQLCWINPQITILLALIVIIWIGLSLLVSKLKDKFSFRVCYRRLRASGISSSSGGGGGGSSNRNNDSESELNFTGDSRRFNRVDGEDDDDEADFSVNSFFKHTYESCGSLYDIFIDQCEGYIDTISSCCVIGIVAFIVTLTALYLSLQIYTESIYLIEKLSRAANSLHQNNPELKAWLPDGINVVHSLLDGAVNNTYQHGREWIRRSTRQLLNNAAMGEFNTTQSAVIEKQMVEFWDRAYGMWLSNRASVSNSSHHLELKMAHGHHHQPYDWDRFLDAFKSLDLTLCTQIFKQNWDTLVSVMDSVIIVLKGNISLVLGAVTAVLSLLIGGGNVLMNFIIDLIIFSTALFYLLCASEDQYKPIELIKNLIPRNEATTLAMKAKGQTNRSEFLNSVDESINAVFTASLKMMAFHGLSTWLLHRLFELEVVYIPAVISALFGAVPFVAPYWASLPACADLWLSGQVSQAVLMLLLATIPSSFVTTAFYSEIKGAGHPYLTGLAIAGGVLVFGIEGALFGPLLLVTIRLLSLVIFYLMDLYK